MGGGGRNFSTVVERWKDRQTDDDRQTRQPAEADVTTVGKKSGKDGNRQMEAKETGKDKQTNQANKQDVRDKQVVGQEDK
jgi:hypothetical protein